VFSATVPVDVEGAFEWLGVGEEDFVVPLTGWCAAVVAEYVGDGEFVSWGDGVECEDAEFWAKIVTDEAGEADGCGVGCDFGGFCNVKLCCLVLAQCGCGGGFWCGHVCHAVPVRGEVDDCVCSFDGGE